jgi:hypothetical protein
MLSIRNDDETFDSLALDKARDCPDLAPCTELSLGDPLGAGAERVDLDEKMPPRRRRLRNEVQETSVVLESQARETSPLESPDAQDEPGRASLPEELNPEALSRLAAREDENGVRGLRVSMDVPHSSRMIAWASVGPESSRGWHLERRGRRARFSRRRARGGFSSFVITA